MYLNHAVILTYQKTFIQPKAVRSISKKKLSSTGYNVHAALSGTRESVFYNLFLLWFKFLCPMDILIF